MNHDLLLPHRQQVNHAGKDQRVFVLPLATVREDGVEFAERMVAIKARVIVATGAWRAERSIKASSDMSQPSVRATRAATPLPSEPRRA